MRNKRRQKSKERRKSKKQQYLNKQEELRKIKKDETYRPKVSRKIANPNDLICPLCFFKVKDINNSGVKNTSVGFWLPPRRELKLWSEGTFTCHNHTFNMPISMYFELLEAVLLAMNLPDKKDIMLDQVANLGALKQIVKQQKDLEKTTKETEDDY